MKAMLLVLGSVLLCMLQTQAAIPKQQNLNIRKVAGLWYTSTMASVSHNFRNDNRGKKIWINFLQPRRSGNLVLRTLTEKGSRCEEDAIVLEKTEDPALFRISNKRSSEFHLVKTNYRGYLIVYARNIYPWQNEVPILFLYGRSIYTKLCTMTLYRSLVRSLQLSEEGLFRLRKPWKCLNTED
ncbi:beta-lactoglobulin-like isoform X1 [Alligator sinensis]|uniref:Beta-lactoglobulin-like isoform X1 n=1 Tax=Alligator sinensis TaxID=38654 RepID=A0A1U7RMM1_ALLSI|nr:beta-lactoglobulin-like isoform X1 [Alligator sinensis]